MSFPLYPEHPLATDPGAPIYNRLKVRGSDFRYRAVSRLQVGAPVNGFKALLCSVVVLAGVALNASAAVPPVEKLLPDDTLAMVTTPDFAKSREAYHNAPQSQLWNDPAMKPFKDQFIAKLNENLIQPLEKDLGVKFEDYTNLAQGQITLAITQNGWPATEGSKMGVLFLLDTRNQSGQLTKNLADLRKKWLEAGKTLRTEKIRNTDFSVVTLSDKDVPKTIKKFSGPDTVTDADESATNAPKTELYIGQAESLLIIGTAAKPIEKVLAHVSGGELPSVGDLAVYEANRLMLFRDAPFYGWVNTKSLLDLWTKQASQESDTPDPFAMLNPTKMLSAIGLSSLKTVAFSVQTANDGSMVQFFASMPEASRQGIFKVFPGDAKDSAPPAFVPADAVKFQRMRIDGKKAWDTLQKVLADISPQAKGAITFMIDTANSVAKEKDPDFDLNKNLFGNLGDDMISYEKAPRGTSAAELSSPPSLFLLGSPNPDQIVSAFKYVLLLTNPQGGAPKEREFLGRKIYTTAMPGAAAAFGADTSGGGRSMNYAASSGYVAFSSDASMIEEYLRSGDSQQKALRETPGLTDAIAKAGGPSTGMLGYENQAETARATFEALRSSTSTNQAAPGPAAMMLGMSGVPSTGSFKDWMDFSLLPPFDKVSKYFGISVYTVSSTPDGVLFKMYAPVPAGLRK